MGAIRMKVQTADKNITHENCNPHDSSPSINMKTFIKYIIEKYVSL